MDKKFRILIVEDEEKLLNLLKNKLIRGGFEPIVAQDGEEALKQAKAHNPDLVILDLLLPKVDGFGVLSQLRESKSEKELPIIVLTNYGNSDNVSRVLSLGAEVFLIKANYSLDEVVNKIKTILKINQ